MIEITFEDIEDINFDPENEVSNAFFNLFEWLDDELEIQPKKLHNIFFLREKDIPINFNPGGLE